LPPQLNPQVFEFCSRFMVVIVIFAIVLFLVWLVTIIDIVKSDFKKDVDKIVWFLFVMIIPPIGALLYLLIGRFQKTGASSFSRYTRYRDIGKEE
jgi:Phospholipase_D-nuclease N-terminal